MYGIYRREMGQLFPVRDENNYLRQYASKNDAQFIANFLNKGLTQHPYTYEVHHVGRQDQE